MTAVSSGGLGEPDVRLPVVVVGAGAMGLEWLTMLAASDLAVVVGVVDLDVPRARAAVAEAGVGDVVVGASVADVADRSGAEAVINVTVPQAHGRVNEQALLAGLPVLCEKPLAPTVREALRQVALADLTGELLMVSQSRRYTPSLDVFREAVSRLGALATVRADFFHDDHEPGFRQQMEHPLLVDMSVHHFDQLRLLTRDRPVAVRCSSWNPSWSWYSGHAAATAEFELRSGARFVYAGSRCTPGLQTSFNAEWRVWGQAGAAYWDGEGTVRLDAGSPLPPTVESPEGIAGSLHAFVTALRTGVRPGTEVRGNVPSLAMVEGAVRSSALGGEWVELDKLLEQSLHAAVTAEEMVDVLAVLRSWPSATESLARPGWGTTGMTTPTTAALAATGAVR